MQRDRGSVRLTAIKVANAKPDPRKRVEIADAGKPGLYLVVQPSGKKSFAVRYRRLSDRAPRKYTLDGFPSLATAHRLAQAVLDNAAEGHDPAADKRVTSQTARVQSSDFVEGVFKDFLDKHVRTKRGRPIRETTRRETARLLGYKRDPSDPSEWIKSGSGVLPRWQGRTVQSIRKQDVLDLLDDLVETGPVAANRTLTALKTCFTWRVRRDGETLPKSPCHDIDDPSPEAERNHVLSDIELAALWRAADAAGYAFGPMVKMLILTGCRRDEVRKAPWAEFDLSARTWMIPSHRTKNGRDHLVPLTDAMAGILEAMPRIKGKAGLLFTTTGETPISGLAKYKRRLHDAMTRELGKEPQRWTLHDLRRTFVTGLQRLRFPLEVAEAAVNHTSGTLAGVTGVYARHDYAQEKREALDAWARHVEAIVSGKPGSVVPFTGRATRG